MCRCLLKVHQRGNFSPLNSELSSWGAWQNNLGGSTRNKVDKKSLQLSKSESGGSWEQQLRSSESDVALGDASEERTSHCSWKNNALIACNQLHTLITALFHLLNGSHSTDTVFCTFIHFLSSVSVLPLSHWSELFIHLSSVTSIGLSVFHLPSSGPPWV